MTTTHHPKENSVFRILAKSMTPTPRYGLGNSLRVTAKSTKGGYNQLLL